MVPSGPPLDTKSGLYQIGMTMSKFAFAEKTTEIDNFRDGFFELQIKEIGLFKEDRKSIYGGNIQAVAKPKVYSKVEAKSKRPMIVKLLLPLVRIFFSEQR